MTIPAEQREVAALLSRLTGAPAPIETHISAVFVGPGEALKLKKAVDLGFLDFTDLTSRERFCRRELEVNRPAAPGIYRDVVPVVRRAADGALALGDPDGNGGEGEVVDWVLRMAPLPPDAFLDRVTARGGLTPELLDATADAVAALHAAALHAAAAVAAVDAPAEMSAVIDGNRAACLDSGLPAQRVEAWAAAAESWCMRIAPVLVARAAEGRVRRCHGDLHLGNLCLWEGRPTPFDALEFDERLATTDTGYDLAFLLMDLDRRAGRAAANRLLNRYVARTGDAGLVGPLPLWLSVRAAIRAHVEARRNKEWGPYLDAAEAYLAPPPATVVAVGGLQGTGKTRLARAVAPGLGPAPGALILRSDEIRKRLRGVAPEERLPPGAYSKAQSRAVHTELLSEAEAVARAGHAVVLDAMFLDPDHRAAAEAVASAAGLPFRGLWLEAPLEVLRARISARRGDASDATVEILERSARANPGPLTGWHRLDAATDPVPEALGIVAIPPRASC